MKAFLLKWESELIGDPIIPTPSGPYLAKLVYSKKSSLCLTLKSVGLKDLAKFLFSVLCLAGQI